MKRMTGIVLGFATLLATNVAGADVRVLTLDDEGQEVRGVNYQLNKELGRARLTVTLYYPNTGYEEDPNTDVNALVPGLSYDARANAVVYKEGDAAPVVCATVKQKRFLWAKWDQIKPTKQCGITRAETVTRIVDDGFERKEERYQVLYFGRKAAR